MQPAVQMKAFSPTRKNVGLISLSVWLGMLFIATGSHAFESLIDSLLFMIVLLVATLTVRSISISSVAAAYLWGSAGMGLAVLFGKIGIALTGDSAFRMAAQPIVEEVLLIAPVLWMLWRWRLDIVFTLGVSDLAILGGAAGAGFAVVEEAYIRTHEGWNVPIMFLPVVTLSGDRIRGYYLSNGHVIWGLLAGVGIGYALYLIKNRRLAAVVLLSGIALGTLDHLALNLNIAWLRFLMLGGYLPVLVSFGGLIAAVVTDAKRLYGSARPKFLPPGLPSAKDKRQSWTSVLDLRSLIYANYSFEQTSGTWQSQAASMCQLFLERIFGRRQPVTQATNKIDN